MGCKPPTGASPADTNKPSSQNQVVYQIPAKAVAAAAQKLELPRGANPTVSKLARFANGSKEESDAAYRARLTRAQYAVLRQKRTEPPNGVKRANGGFEDVFDAGLYSCGACGA